MSNSNNQPAATLSVAAARARILANLSALKETELVHPRAALGRVLAADVVSPIDVPAHDNSAVDGYAVRLSDLSPSGETRLKSIGSALADHAFRGKIAAGEALRMMTGAVLPRAFDAVVMLEDVREEGDGVVIPAGIKARLNVRSRGEDLARGKPALPAGKRLTAADVGLIASLGLTEVAVVRRLKVALLSTGDELCSLGETLQPGQVFDSNRYTLSARLASLGCEILDLGVARDSLAALAAAFRQALSADLVMTSGAISLGETDFIRALLDQLGRVDYWQIAMRPGRPMAFGRIGQNLFFALPGNPLAALVTFDQFVRPALLTLMGVQPVSPTLGIPAICDTALGKPAGRTEFLRGIVRSVDGALHVTTAGAQGSGILRSMSLANCYIVLPPECVSVAVGDAVQIELFAD